MVTVTANERGYFDGELREIGASFVVPDALWNDEERRPKWASLSRGGAGVARIVRPKTGETDGAAEIPDDWQNLTAAERKALAKAISGEPAPNVREAYLVIAAEIERRAAEAGSGDNAPTRVSGNGLQEALGVQPPDWVAPAAP
ncbi:hypothetical protein FHS26_005579 [Rhizobium pisi]|uniref:Uncharacterized protein n=1 Tax=Rhizobium pisi TaxID=574561 RepID=A0A3R9BNP9_9HYPH|nr:hypothetical protein [Rhizobium pisi]MBB3137811.1 hypothetical protein [Rhizobium pisi]RSB65885.1 hypothetical protein EFD55_25950 [Rhizobium pisi]TCA47708.1 hypothetical protein E0J16_27515 [Rhizobium pisi]